MLVDTAKSGTARKLVSLDFPVAAKTGTAERAGTSSNTDAVTVAYTPENTLVVWYGNASMKPEHDLPRGTTGGGITAFVARNALSTIQKEKIEFQQPESVARGEKDLYALRFPPREEVKFVAPTLDGKVVNGNAVIWFPAFESQLYEIYKNGQLMEVIRGKVGEYQFMDEKMGGKNPSEYHIKSRLVTASELGTTEEPTTSNTIKLYPSKENAHALRGTPKKRHWFF